MRQEQVLLKFQMNVHIGRKWHKVCKNTCHKVYTNLVVKSCAFCHKFLDLEKNN